MVLSTHAVVGAALGNVLPGSPGVAFLVGMLSHYVLDAVPHWHYRLRSSVHNEDVLKRDLAMDQRFARDLLRMALDVATGVAVIVPAYVGAGNLLHPSRWPLAVILGAVGAVLPDALQFVYMKFRHEPLRAHQRFHGWVHARSRLDDRPLLGIGSQVAVAALALWFF